MSGEVSKTPFLQLDTEFPEIGIETMRNPAHLLVRTTARLENDSTG
jgi:hypothetical protein